MQRKIRKETKNEGIGTKAQIALKKQYEENKLINKKINKDRKNEIKERKFQLKQIKKKKKSIKDIRIIIAQYKITGLF